MKKIFTCIFKFVMITALLFGATSTAEQAYKIGDRGPCGGIIFYVDKKGFTVYDGMGGKEICHYLEMSESTLGESKWYPEYLNIGTETGLGYGKSNTFKILNAKTSNKDSEKITVENCAAYRCVQFSSAGDWFLPSRDELDLILKNQKQRVIATSRNSCHWSSSEKSSMLAWVQFFNNGFSFQDDFGWKDFGGISVRAVRAF